MNLEHNSYNYEKIHSPRKKNYGGLVTALLLVALLILTLLVATTAYLILDGTGQLPEQYRLNNLLQQPATQAAVEVTPELTEDFTLNFEPVTEGQLTTESLYDIVAPQTVGVSAYLGDSMISRGSGVVISEEGHIVTNDHVVNGSNRIDITMYNGDVLSATLIGGDPSSDLAVLELDNPPSDLSPASFGDSSDIATGEKVVVIGSPGGLAASITDGIVSGPSRTKSYITGNPEDEDYSLIQTTAAINPGNSGGALVDTQGQVIGIVSIKIVNINYEGIGFAIPTSEALPIIETLLVNGSIPGKAQLGVSVVPVDKLDVSIPGYEEVGGLFLLEVEPHSDLNNYGITPNDIIISADGIELIENTDLTDLIDSKNIGDPIELVIWKAATGRLLQLTAVLVDSNSAL